MDDAVNERCGAAEMDFNPQSPVVAFLSALEYGSKKKEEHQTTEHLVVLSGGEKGISISKRRVKEKFTFDLSNFPGALRSAGYHPTRTVRC